MAVPIKGRADVDVWWSLARNFFCNLTWGSAIVTRPRSPTTTCGEGWREEEEDEEEEDEEEEEEEVEEEEEEDEAG